MANGSAVPRVGAPAAAVGTTLGVEEEFHVLDPATGRLSPHGQRVLDQAGEELEPELLRSAVETATPICRTLEEIRAALVTSRRALRAAAGRVDLWVATAGTVPDAGTRPVGVHPDARYEQMAEDYQQLVREQNVCACQVQVGVPDRDLAVALGVRMRRWLSVLLALSTSSPFFNRTDTGYASYRTVLWSRWPTAGPASEFSSAAEYDATIQALIDGGVITDPRMAYFELRPSARYPTLEIRIADACPLVDDAVLLAGLGRALVVTADAEERAGGPPPETRVELLRGASWRAARSGLTDELLDPDTGEAVPGAEMVERLLAHLRGALEDSGDWATVRDLAEAVVRRGTSADRQRAAFARSGSFADVVALLVEETAAGT